MSISTQQKPARSGIGAFLSLLRSFSAFAGRRGVLALVYVALGAVFESFGILLIVPLLGVVIGGVPGRAPFGHATNALLAMAAATTPFERLAILMSGFAVLVVSRAVVVTLRDVSVMALQNDFVDRLRAEISAALADAGWERVLRLRHARVLTLMSSDVSRIASATHFLLQAGIAIAILLSQCVLSFWLSPRLALFAFAMLIGGGIMMVPVLRRAREFGRQMGATNQWLLESTNQFLGGLKLALSQNLQGGFVAEMRAALLELRARQRAFFGRQAIGRAALTTIAALVGAIVVLVGYGVLGLPAPILIAFLLIIGRMSGPAGQIQQGFQQLALGLPAYEAVSDLLDELRTAPSPAPVATGAISFEGPILFEAVTFQHPHADESQSRGVRDIDLAIARGEILGITGSSGAGKTTLADLLVGLIEPNSGRIRIGDRLLDDQARCAWRSQISYVSQDPFLFHDTIRRNLRWVRPEATEAEMWNALAVAGADTIVRRMDGGLDAVVGERGTLVSGGERQRLALARALLRTPRLLVLDEATNAIDVAGERQLLERIAAIRPRPTIVVIAHRSETLALCDRIVRMEDGRIHEGDIAAAAPGA